MRHPQTLKQRVDISLKWKKHVFTESISLGSYINLLLYVAIGLEERHTWVWESMAL